MSSGEPELLEAAAEEITSRLDLLDKNVHEFLHPNTTLAQTSSELTQNIYGLLQREKFPFPLKALQNKRASTKASKIGLEKLYLNGFTAEQIWQQLEIFNQPFLKKRATVIVDELLGGDETSSSELDEVSNERLLAVEDQDEDSADDDIEAASDLDELREDITDGESEAAGKDENVERAGSIESEEEGRESTHDLNEDVSPAEAQDEEDEGEEDTTLNSDNNKMQDDDDEVESLPDERTEVDDEFFSLQKMHKMVEVAEEAELNPPSNSGSDDDEYEIDYFNDPDTMASDDDTPADMIKYSDFFKAPANPNQKKAEASSTKPKVRFNVDNPNSDDDDDDAEEDEEGESQAIVDEQSNFEKKQLKMTELINRLEDEGVDRKHWAMSGETMAFTRPKDSLLGEDLEFDHAAKPPPVVTLEVTETIEQLIKTRILDEKYDDVVKPTKKKLNPLSFKGDQIELDVEKSKKSLAELYEDDYQKIVSGKTGEEQDVPEEVVQARERIKAIFRGLNYKLDALSHAHYTPKLAQLEVQVIQDKPALAMEERIPVAVSDATLLAPEEVYAQSDKHNQAGVVIKDATQELSKEERNRIRNRKKRLFKTRAKNRPKA